MAEALSREERDRISALAGLAPALCRLLEDDGELLPFLLKDVPGEVGERLPYVVAAGVPARVIRHR